MYIEKVYERSEKMIMGWTDVGFHFVRMEVLDAGENHHISISLDGVVIRDTI